MNNKRLSTLLICCSLLISLSGCASWFGPKPGLLSVGVTDKCAVSVEDGRQYAKIVTSFKRNNEGLCEGKFEATGVEAFQGQAIGAQQSMAQMQIIQALLSAVLAKLPGSPLPVVQP